MIYWNEISFVKTLHQQKLWKARIGTFPIPCTSPTTPCTFFTSLVQFDNGKVEAFLFWEKYMLTVRDDSFS